MSDERIERLTELALRIYGTLPELSVYAHEDAAGVYVDGKLGVRIAHPRAADALEAALLVLAEDVTIREVRYAGCPRSVCRPASPAGVEQLVADARAEAIADVCDYLGLSFADIPAELRERAKGTP